MEKQWEDESQESFSDATKGEEDEKIEEVGRDDNERLNRGEPGGVGP